MIKILDSTLREGEQTPGVYFSPEKKLVIAHFLDQIGIDIIEVGNPAVDSDIALAINLISQAGLKAKIGAHSLCKIDNVQKALDCGIDFLGVFFSVSKKRLYQDYNISLEAAIEKIVEVINFAREQKNDLLIRYTPEDTVRSPIENVIAAASAAVKAGVNIISIADTTGYTNPFHPQRSIYNYVKTLKEELKKQDLHPQIEVHCHNDKGLALANALDAYRAGADIIDVSVMGLGERAGIVDLGELLINLREMGEEETHWQLGYLQDLYNFVSEHSHISIPPHQPITGKNAFTHYAGVHVKAIAKDEMLYQSLDPQILGKKSSLALGMQSGYTAVELAMKQIGREELAENKDLVAKILQEIKAIAKRGTPIDIEKELPEIVERCNIKQMMTKMISG
ncbi:LeuA family protein [Trichormus variabilis]|uniref:Homocitrate synthase n=1 Tax=Trichormus variabilis SAG 1403-4b TaxID=447716 RepID=A0A3S1AUU6_ANAVA|nr:2-isopropylmalate synthase [Trichormus variabilis]MBD2625228.1 2-isopropylmalate synthase [Trichormus variabilis FACHB-164]RUS99599.1 homocitrate synthase [Trichormus variabilis SAG 1403-4b]